MNFILELGFTGISAKRAFLFGNKDRPILLFSFLFFSIIIFRTNVFWMFIDAIKDSNDLDSVWVRLAPSIRLEKKKIRAKERSIYERWKKEQLQSFIDSSDRAIERRREAENELSEARSTIRHLTKMLAEKDDTSN